MARPDLSPEADVSRGEPSHGTLHGVIRRSTKSRKTVGCRRRSRADCRRRHRYVGGFVQGWGRFSLPEFLLLPSDISVDFRSARSVSRISRSLRAASGCLRSRNTSPSRSPTAITTYEARPNPDSSFQGTDAAPCGPSPLRKQGDQGRVASSPKMDSLSLPSANHTHEKPATEIISPEVRVRAPRRPSRSRNSLAARADCTSRNMTIEADLR